MKKALYLGFILAFIGEVLSLVGIAISSQLISQSDPVAKTLGGAFIGLLLINFGIMIAFYRASSIQQ